MKEYNIIGDVHGCYDLLLKLAKKMPDAPFFSLGDMIDRGTQSLEVVRFFMKEGHRAVLGNHEHLMLDTYFGRRRIYDKGLWLYPGNGGYHTLKSFAREELETYELLRYSDPTIGSVNDYVKKHKKRLIPEDIIEWVDNLPLYHEEEGLFLSHAPKPGHRTLEDLKDSKKEKPRERLDNLLWNIGAPAPIEGMLQVFGHVIHKKPKWYYKDETPFAVGIDTIGGDYPYPEKLTGLHWPSLKTYTVS